MKGRILITGGAGFIGSHVADRLIKEGYHVIIYDYLEPQVHSGKPDYLNPEAEFIEGDIRDRDMLRKVLHRVDAVSHQAAVVGVGQSMYEIERYVDINIKGTATLLDLIVNDSQINIEKLIIASSMSVYGEGAYICPQCGDAKYPSLRDLRQLKARDWELHCPDCGAILEPCPTPESKPLHSTSIYALTKKAQEEMALLIGKTYGIPTVALRYFNVYGARQSLNNPYTGVCAIFSSRIKNNKPPLIYEDGLQTRDFIHVYDIARANQLVIESPQADMQVLNVGTGQPRSVKEIAETLIRLYGKEGQLRPKIVNRFRAGDVRHCYADITKIQHLLGFKPTISFEEGMQQLVEWAEKECAQDKFEFAQAELQERSLIL